MRGCRSACFVFNNNIVSLWMAGGEWGASGEEGLSHTPTLCRLGLLDRGTEAPACVMRDSQIRVLGPVPTLRPHQPILSSP